MWVLGLSVTTLSSLQACGSDGGGRIRDKDDGSAGNDGTGARSSGGRSGTGGASGASGAGGSTGACNLAACDQQLAPIQGLLGMFGGGAISLKSCCVNATTCGIDLGAIIGTPGAGCVDPTTLIMPPAPGVDSGAPPTGIQLDKSCPDIANAAFDLPGCCRSNGLCGGSTHTVQGAGTDFPIACVSYDTAAMSAASANLGVVVPEDPNIHCKYTIGPPDVPEAGVPDASPPAPVPDASPPAPVPDASPPGRPDAGATPDAAATRDAAPTPPAAKDAAVD
jgi:hypothetical protein